MSTREELDDFDEEAGGVVAARNLTGDLALGRVVAGRERERAGELFRDVFGVGGADLDQVFAERGDQVGGFAFGDDLSAVHEHQSVTERGFVRAMGRGGDGQFVGVAACFERAPEGAEGVLVEAGGRFVEQQRLRGHDERAGQIEAALHAAREGFDPVVGAGGEIEGRQEVVGLAARGVPIDAAHLGREQEVVAGGELAVEARALEDDRERGAGPRRGGGEARTVRWLPVEVPADPTRFGQVQAGQQ